ncbi:MAG: prephenate dehydrogenase/arogenate dehydrogenase family protein [Phycisphaerales bacterium]|nr:prephenate dehydrogenase/arogenate dehydrogenase family protein [Phycisphaerales bacterium]
MSIQRISILGTGLLGGSIGLALKSASSDYTITGYGHNASTIQRAVEVGAVDHGTSDLVEAVTDAQLVILCTPVGVFGDILLKIGSALGQGAIVTDVGSTKRSVVRLAEAHLPAGVHFVASHPIAGSEKRGVEFARTDLFDKKLCIVTPTDQTNPVALETVEQLWRQIGMRTTRLSPDDHDRLLANISHLPHLLAAALVAMQPEEALGLSGKGFLDTTRIAGGDGGLWRDILLDNRDHLAESVGLLKSQLDAVLKMLRDDQGDSLRQWLNDAAARREQLMRDKLRELNSE